MHAFVLCTDGVDVIEGEKKREIKREEEEKKERKKERRDLVSTR